MDSTVNKTDEDQKGIKTLIVYYSLGGNTKGIAQNIQKILGADIAEIEPLVPYTGSYDDIVDHRNSYMVVYNGSGCFHFSHFQSLERKNSRPLRNECRLARNSY